MRINKNLVILVILSNELSPRFSYTLNKCHYHQLESPFAVIFVPGLAEFCTVKLNNGYNWMNKNNLTSGGPAKKMVPCYFTIMLSSDMAGT